MSRIILTLMLLTCCWLHTFDARAQSVADIEAAARQSDTILRQQQERLREDMEQARKSAPQEEGADLRKLVPKTTVPDLGRPCQLIGEIRVIGAEQLGAQLIREVTQPYLARCLGVTEIEAILSELTRRYIERGYVTTRVYLPAQDLGSGILLLRVIEGVIEDYRIDGNSPGVHVPGAFPVKPGELLNLRDLEQGIDQINRLSSNNAKLDIQPGSRAGSSLVIVRNTQTFPAHVNLSIDNQGVDSTGKYGAAVSLTVDSPLHLNERFVFSHRESFSPNTSGHESKNNALEFWVPLGYSALTMNVGRSNYVNMLNFSSGTTLLSEGQTDSAGIGIDRGVYRDQSKRASVSAKVSVQDTKNYLAGLLLGVSSRKLTTLELGSNGFMVTPYGMLTGQLTYANGLKAFGALNDAPALPDDAPHAQFRKLSLDLSFSRTFALAKQNLTWSSQWSGQYGFTTLYGSQQMLIGGASSVRGFLDNTLSGDHGYHWRNELSLPISLELGATPMTGRAYIGYDFGKVQGRAAGTSSGYLSGAALGMSMQWKGLSWDLSGTRALALPASMTRESAQLWLRLSYSI